jgi:hypothetical protein
VGRDHLIVFCFVDEHVHTSPMGEPEALDRCVRAITRSMRLLTAVPVDGPRLKVIEDRTHMENVAGYVLRQPEHHHLPVHSALWSGGCVPDLMGARLVPGLTLRLADALPRHTQRDVLEAVGLPPSRLEMPGPEALRLLGAGALYDAACAALCVVPQAGCHAAGEVMARRAALVLVQECGIPLTPVAAAASCPERSARRLAASPLPPEVRQAVLRHLAIEVRVREVAPGR